MFHNYLRLKFKDCWYTFNDPLLQMNLVWLDRPKYANNMQHVIFNMSNNSLALSYQQQIDGIDCMPLYCFV